MENLSFERSLVHYCTLLSYAGKGDYLAFLEKYQEAGNITEEQKKTVSELVQRELEKLEAKEKTERE